MWFNLILKNENNKLTELKKRKEGKRRYMKQKREMTVQIVFILLSIFQWLKYYRRNDQSQFFKFLRFTSGHYLLRIIH